MVDPVEPVERFRSFGPDLLFYDEGPYSAVCSFAKPFPSVSVFRGATCRCLAALRPGLSRAEVCAAALGMMTSAMADDVERERPAGGGS